MGSWRIRAQDRGFQGLSWENEGKWMGPFFFVQAADTQLGMIHSFATTDRTKSNWDPEVTFYYS